MEPSLSWEAASCSVAQEFPNIKQLEDSLPCSQEAATDRYPEPDESSPYHPTLFL
jgi:hypothetical protein